MLLRVIACIVSFVLVGCSVRPLPEDVTGYDTVQIVSRVRCEVRDGIRAYITGALARPERAERFPRYRELVGGLENGTLEWRHLRAYLKKYGVDPDTMRVFERYNSAAIGYEFTFDIGETNNHGGGLDFLSTLTNGTAKLGVTASSDLSRGNTRTFRAVDSFEFLASLLPEEYCDPRQFVINAHRNERNLIYPISGSLGLAELIGTFLNLNQSGNLVGMEASGAEAEIPTIVDKMQFITKFTGGATPSIELTPASRRLSLSKAHFTTTNSREDTHTLRIVVKLPAREWIPRTIAERRIVDTARVISGVPPRQLSKVAASAPLATRMKSLVAEELAAEPTRELIEATIKFRSQLTRVVVD